MTTRFWRSNELSDAVQGSGWPGSTFENSNHRALIEWDAGDTILRSRIQGHVLIGLSEITASGLDTLLSAVMVTEPYFGLYADPALDVMGSPQPIPADPYDGHWLQHNAMSCKQVFNYTDLNLTTKAMALYNFDAGVSESFAKRGPATMESTVFLVWSFFNVVNDYWAVNDSNYQGIFSAAVVVHVLFETP